MALDASKKNIHRLREEFPLIKRMTANEEVFWANPHLTEKGSDEFSAELILEAAKRLDRFRPFFKAAFKETEKNDGLIESPLVKINYMEKFYREKTGASGHFYAKLDSCLPISGSIKARGGIYEIIKYAEKLAIEEGILNIKDDYAIISSKKFKEFYGRYNVSVGSTGNLGLSIGIISSELGFKVTVHMSEEAMQWKKDLLRKRGVNVIEHRGDYGKAVEEGRKEAGDACHFVDDEHSIDLFAGYSVAALRLARQLSCANIEVGENNPLFVYLPCGVGGGPGGVSYGLNHVFGNHIHCFFAEPVQSPCMLLGLMTGLHDEISVDSLGLTNKTCADGLAVGRASSFAGKIVAPFLKGAYTVTDDNLFRLVAEMADREQIYLEPSATAGFYAPFHLFDSKDGQNYLENRISKEQLNNATHIMWATGGAMVPNDIMEMYCEKGRKLKVQTKEAN